MPVFNPEVKAYDAEPNYLRYSRGIGANNKWGDLLKNTSNLFVQGAETYNDAAKKNRQDEIEGQVKGLFGEPGSQAQQPQTAAAPQTDTQEIGMGATTGEAPSLVASSSKAGGGLPGSAQPMVDDLKKLGQANDAGRFNPSYYWGSAAAKVSQLKAMYPGHGDDVDEIVKKYLGHVPANEYVRTMLAETQHQQREAETERKQIDSYIRQHPDDAPPDYWERKLSGNPYPLAVAEAYTAKNVARKANLDWEKKQLSEARAERQDVGERGSRVLLNELSMRMDKMLTDGTDAVGSKLSDNFKLVQAKGKESSPQELQATESALQAAEAQWDKVEYGVLSQPWAGDPTKNYYTELKPQDIEAVRKQVRERMKTYADLLRNHDYGILNVHAQNTKRVIDADELWLLNNVPFARMWAANKKIGTTDAINNELLNSPEFKSGFAQMANFNNLFQGAAGVGSMKQSFQKMSDAQNTENNKGVGGKTLVTGSEYRTMLESYTKLIANPSLPNEGVKNLVNHMFTEPGFLGLFKPQDQVKVYQTLLTPSVTDRIKEVSKSNPQLWEKYKAFALDGFQSTMSATISDLGDFANRDIDWDVDFDTKANQFVYRPSGATQSPDGRQMIDKAVGDINRQLRVLEPILRHDKEPVGEQVAKILQARGIPIHGPSAEQKPGTFWQKVGAAAMKSLKQSTATVGGEQPLPNAAKEIERAFERPAAR